MVSILNGRYDFPDDNLYDEKFHVYVNKNQKLVGLDQIGYAFLKNPRDLKILAEGQVKIGDKIAEINTDNGIKTFYSPCTGAIKATNSDALSSMKDDIYTKGYILEFSQIDELDPKLIGGNNIEKWALSEAKPLMENTYVFKIIEMGDSTVGKTAIKVRFTDDYFKQDLKTTFGVDFGTKEVEVEVDKQDILFSGTYKAKAKITVWDVAGQEHYKSNRGMYYRGARGALLCYDVTNPVSFKNLDEWLEEMEENVGTNLPILMVGNKIDLERKVPKADAEAYAKKHGFIYVECSAKTGDGVQNTFEKLAIALIKKTEEE